MFALQDVYIECLKIAHNEDLFNGQEDYQFDVYRKMQTENP